MTERRRRRSTRKRRVERAAPSIESRASTASQAAARGLLTAAERDLKQIILDIHDGPVQDIFGALSQIHLLRLRPEMQVGDGSIMLGRIAASLQRALTEIRNFIGAFRPPEFERRAIGAILEGLVVQHEEMTGHPVDFEATDELPEVSLPLKIALYRILQEALANASRHGGGTRSRVTLALREGDLSLEVRDFGKGFDVKRVLKTESDVGVSGGHFGLRGMRDRVEIMNGTLDIESGPGGTCVTVRLPLA